jgi:RNA polymerase sigma-70 factor (ECF subfamily)
MPSTHGSLLDRLRETADTDAWVRFVRLYTPLLSNWASRSGVPEADAADLVQDVLTIVVQQMPAFQHDPRRSFRAWLRTILVNRWRERLRKRQPATSHQLDQVPAAPEPSLPDEAEDRRQLLRRALTLVQAEIAPAAWEAFRRTALLGQPGADVAAELNMTVNAVYIARSRVLQRLRQLVGGMLP